MQRKQNQHSGGNIINSLEHFYTPDGLYSADHQRYCRQIFAHNMNHQITVSRILPLRQTGMEKKTPCQEYAHSNDYCIRMETSFMGKNLLHPSNPSASAPAAWPAAQGHVQHASDILGDPSGEDSVPKTGACPCTGSAGAGLSA
jgi:hypothetical protein